MSDMLDIGASAVVAYQRVLATVSNNVANVGSDSYVRQQAVVAPGPVAARGQTYLGTGAVFAGVQRQVDAFTETSLRRSLSDVAAQAPQATYAAQLLDTLGSPTAGLTPALDGFFTSVRALAADPASSLQRTTLLRDAAGLAQRFGAMADQIDSVELETRLSAETAAADIDGMARQLAQLNREFMRHSLASQQPAGLMDQRDQLLRDLSERVDLQVQESANGSVTVALGNEASGAILVEGARARRVGVATDPAEPSRMTLTLDPGSRDAQVVQGITGGTLGGLMAFRAQVLGPATDGLDHLARTLAAQANALHRQGIDAEGRPGGDLFVLEPAFQIQRSVGAEALNVQARVSDTSAAWPAQLQIRREQDSTSTLSLAGSFAAGDRIDVNVGGTTRRFVLAEAMDAAALTPALSRFMDAAFGDRVQVDTQADGNLLLRQRDGSALHLNVTSSSTTGTLSQGQRQGVWVTTDPATGRTLTSVDELTVGGVTVALQGDAPDGSTVDVTLTQRPAAGLRAAFTDPLRLATGDPFRVRPGPMNLGSASATVLRWSDPAAERRPAPIGEPGGLSGDPAVAAATVLANVPAEPVALVAAGQRDARVLLDLGDLPEPPRDLVVFTREGRQVAGPPFASAADGQAFIDERAPAFATGSTWAAAPTDAANTTAWRGATLVYGAVAEPSRIERRGPDHSVTQVDIAPARLEAEHAPSAPDTPLDIGDGALQIDGRPLPALHLPAAANATARLEDLVYALNDALASAEGQNPASVQAQAVQGRLVLTRPGDADSASPQPLRLTLGADGRAADLARMGLRTGVHLAGAAAEDLLVFATGAGELRLSASVANAPPDAREVLRSQSLTVAFTTADRYQVLDSQGTVLAERAHVPGAAIAFQGLTLSLQGKPAAGDRFVVDGNHNAPGDGRNLARLAALEQQPVAGVSLRQNLGEAWLGVVDDVGSAARQSSITRDAMEVIRDQAVARRDAVSGVSLDQEAADLVRFQQAYQAAAKTMQVASDLFDTIVRL